MLSNGGYLSVAFSLEWGAQSCSDVFTAVGVWPHSSPGFENRILKTGRSFKAPRGKEDGAKQIRKELRQRESFIPVLPVVSGPKPFHFCSLELFLLVLKTRKQLLDAEGSGRRPKREATFPLFQLSRFLDLGPSRVSRFLNMTSGSWTGWRACRS